MQQSILQYKVFHPTEFSQLMSLQLIQSIWACRVKKFYNGNEKVENLFEVRNINIDIGNPTIKRFSANNCRTHQYLSKENEGK